MLVVIGRGKAARRVVGTGSVLNAHVPEIQAHMLQ